MKESLAEIESRLNISNLVYWFFHREDILRARSRAGNDTRLRADTIAKSGPENKKEREDGR